jgi:hypothetical protein
MMTHFCAAVTDFCATFAPFCRSAPERVANQEVIRIHKATHPDAEEPSGCSAMLFGIAWVLPRDQCRVVPGRSGLPGVGMGCHGPMEPPEKA